ncbi:hypothetical protein [Paractinoplanes hotanensis]|uniref:DAHP synthetase I/KDSA domain-containing protein n=1 Tax=Paractinoplanes hotanensis TaxID=2906497 RepID=A0ABT0YAM6_9ACTN|nr:hypothetical protein [Actinoplanes hotanensis]MCM4083095.1 hypothetical protein [Actinoplanes hotanensis]
MLVEITPSAAPPAVARLAARIAVHDDVAVWPVRLAGRAFLVLAGDEALATRVDSPLILAWHRTADRGHWLVDRTSRLVGGPVAVGASRVGPGEPLWCAAGPCALESPDDAVATGWLVAEQGGDAIRASLFKTRSSPYHFPGRRRRGLTQLAELRRRSGLPVITEVTDPRDVEPVAAVADCLHVDPRHMTNTALLAELGGAGRPVLLMRGSRATVAEWLRAAEHVVSRGNPDVILCARGVVSFDRSLAFQPDYGAIAAVRRHTDLPVIFDPSHSTGDAAAVPAAALAAAAYGVDGLLIETHVRPAAMYRPGDADQMIAPGSLGAILSACREVRDIAAKLGDRTRVLMTSSDREETAG